jgi:hypothetical protein
LVGLPISRQVLSDNNIDEEAIALDVGDMPSQLMEMQVDDIGDNGNGEHQ